jgi:hypothetical protein
VADENVMSTTPGHGYLLREGRLSRVPIARSCTCNQPRSHDQRVFLVLQISRLVKDGKLLFLPHHRLSKLGWFVVLSPRESSSMQGSVDSLHRVIQALHAELGKHSKGLSADEKAYCMRQDATPKQLSKKRRPYYQVIVAGILSATSCDKPSAMTF